LLRSLQLLVAQGQGLQDPVLVPGVPAPALPLFKIYQQTLCCCCSDHYSYLWRKDKVFKTQFWCLVFQRRLYLYLLYTNKRFAVVAQIITVTCGARKRSSRPSSGAWCSSAGSTSIKVPTRRKKGRHMLENLN
jgi:hypothetical protein